METLKKMRWMMMAMICAVTLIGFTSCSDDDEEPGNDTKKAASYTFELEYKKIDGTDNAKISNAILHYVDYQGKEVNKTLPLIANTASVKSQPYQTLPGELVVTINESLKPNVALEKEVYTIGMNLKFTLTTFDAEGGIIDMQSQQQSSTMSVDKENLSKLYPTTTSYSYAIDVNGKISAK